MFRISLAVCLLAFSFNTSAAPDMDALDNGLWIDRQRLMQLAMTGIAWEELVEEANQPLARPDLTDQEEETNVLIFAKALIFGRTGETQYKDEVIEAITTVMGTETAPGGRTLALGRNLLAYVLAADLVGLPPELDQRFRDWLKEVSQHRFPSGKTLISTHEKRPNNWGTAAGASRIAIAGYLRDDAEFQRAAQVFKGWLGDRSSYTGFKYKQVDSWQADPDKPVGINPKGSMRDGHNIDGVLPDDMRRSGPFRWPPARENYVYTALAGALAQAVLLDRAGYDAFDWEEQALWRAYQWLYQVAYFPAVGNDTWQPYLINYFYQADLAVTTPARFGKIIGFTDWTHQAPQ